MSGWASAPGAISRSTAVLLGLVIAVGAVVRFVGIGDKSLWIDEVFSVWVCGQSTDEIVRISAELDLHPPLYYALLHLWSLLPDLASPNGVETMARSLSALFGVGALPLTYLIGARIGGRLLGLGAAGVLALSPLHLYYAQQVRMYTMLTFFAATATLSLLHVLDPDGTGDRTGEPGTRRRPDRWWLGLAVSTTLVMLSHNTGVLLPASVAIYLLIAGARHRRRGAPRLFHPFHGPSGVLTAFVAAAVLWLPWLPTFLSQVRRVDAEFWLSPPTATTVLEHWADLTSAYADRPVRVVAGIAAAVLVTVGLVRGRRTAGLTLMAVLLVVPPIVELAVSARRPVFFTQTMIWTSVPFSVLVAAGVLALRHRVLVLTAAVAVVLVSGMGILGVHRFAGKEDWRAASGHLARRAGDGDLVLFSAGWSQLPFDHYYTRGGGPALIRHGLPVDMFERGILEPKMTATDVPRLESLTAQRDSLWVVYSHDWYTDPAGIVPASLASRWQQVDVRDFPGIRLVQYRLSVEGTR